MIESIVEHQDKVKDDEYPKLMICEGMVVYFYMDSCGIVINDPQGAWRYGEHSEGFDMEQFYDFHGKVTLISK